MRTIVKGYCQTAGSAWKRVRVKDIQVKCIGSTHGNLLYEPWYASQTVGQHGCMLASGMCLAWLLIHSTDSLLACGSTVKLSPCPCSLAGWIAACLCGHSKCNLLLAQARPRMIQHLTICLVVNWYPNPFMGQISAVSSCWSSQDFWCCTTDYVFCNVIGGWKILRRKQSTLMKPEGSVERRHLTLLFLGGVWAQGWFRKISLQYGGNLKVYSPLFFLIVIRWRKRVYPLHSFSPSKFKEWKVIPTHRGTRIVPVYHT